MPKVCPNCAAQFADAFAVCPTDGATLRAADPGGDFIGTIVADRYVITEVLGEGGMGKVYRARHVRLPREAAIKVLHPRMVQDPAAVARFDREAANASRIDHENVVRVFDFGETQDGLVYLAMEFVAGQNLKDLVEKEGPLPLARAASFVRQVADGLDAAHRLGIVHRDLKPDNILVVRDERGVERCKIADFGIAKAIGSGEKSLTQTGFVIGTPEYMSPEQLLGEEIDHRSDVYALALVAYQCLTGETPFDSKTPDRGMMARLTNQPRALADLRPAQAWPKDVQQVLNKGLDRERAKRYESAGQFAAALERAMTSPVAVATPTPVKATPIVERARTPVAVPVVKRADPQPKVPYRQTPRHARSAEVPAIPVQPRPAQAPRARRIIFWPRLPIVRWAGTALLIGFGWLLLTEGSVPRAIRKAGVIARRAESSMKRMVGGSSTAARPRAATAPAASNAAATGDDSVTAVPEPTMPELNNPPTVQAPTTNTPSAKPVGAPPAADPPVAKPPVANPPSTP